MVFGITISPGQWSGKMTVDIEWSQRLADRPRQNSSATLQFCLSVGHPLRSRTTRFAFCGFLRMIFPYPCSLAGIGTTITSYVPSYPGPPSAGGRVSPFSTACSAYNWESRGFEQVTTCCQMRTACTCAANSRSKMAFGE